MEDSLGVRLHFLKSTHHPQVFFVDTENLLFPLKQIAEWDSLHLVAAPLIDRNYPWWPCSPIFLVKAFELHVASGVTDQVVYIFAVFLLLEDVRKVILRFKISLSLSYKFLF